MSTEEYVINQRFGDDPGTSSANTLTDNSGGTASTTIADITEANNAGSADRVPTENAIASLTLEVNSLKTAVDALIARGTK